MGTPQAHHDLARWAIDHRHLGWELMCLALAEVTRRFDRGDQPRLELWVEQGWLAHAALSAYFEATHELLATPELDEETAQQWRARHSGEFDTIEPLVTTLVREVRPEEFARRERELRFNHGQEQRSLPELLHGDSDHGARRASLALATPMEFYASRVHSAQARLHESLHQRVRARHTPTSLEESTEMHAVRELAEDRYVIGRELGRGGGGRVVRAYDRLLGRTVAMKILHYEGLVPPQALARFIAEAQTTGQLDHPNIMPIYDFGTLPDGSPYYTMREVSNHSLRSVITQLKGGDEELAREYTVVRLVEIVRQVCLAVHFAHARGVVHRDLKPDNILIGDYGEVLVVDWGLARLLEPQEQIVYLGELSEAGQTLGTPAYMPPEQARGELDVVDELSDVYSIGAILYEALTLRPPFGGQTPLEVMWRVIEEPLIPPRQRAPQREIPERLEAICARALRRERHERHNDARQLYDELTGWIEGHQPRLAAQATRRADTLRQEYRRALREAEALAQQVRERRDEIEAWAPIARKRTLWDEEDRLRALMTEGARAFGRALSTYQSALAMDPGHARARQALSEMYSNRIIYARRERDPIVEVYFSELLERIDDTGAFMAKLSGPARVTITSQPPGADLIVWPLRLRDRRLVEGDPIPLGTSPAAGVELPAGRYLLCAQRPGAPSVVKAVRLEPASVATFHLDVPEGDEYREGFIYVPSGTATLGGDRNAFPPRPEQAQFIPGFFCARLPVTFGEYLEWLDVLQQQDPREAQARAPQLRASDGMLATFDQELGRWCPVDILIEGPARQQYPAGQGHEARLPIVGISAHDAMAYTAWRARRDGVAYRLPYAFELEKAARSEDGRFFPWGDHFDATFCKMLSSRAEPSQPEPVGSFRGDRSPYGVQDLAGGVMEWCMREAEHIDFPIKGGAWHRDQRLCRAASEVREFGEVRTAGLGFRLVYDPRGMWM